MTSNLLLKAENVGIQFGGLKAVQNVNMYLNQGELVGLIGPNGAGKTTTFNMITGVYQPTVGAITFAGRNLKGLKPYQVTKQ
ncbi:TPA: ATP-binding cassette domain-containing protein, partial [Salmonella enterica subsp. enterica serovar Typhi str. AG3]|nr:ATP-binding cassette domain-containing protein [Salmonella enterica subsp. enterica serovar Typhi str. AG3]